MRNFQSYREESSKRRRDFSHLLFWQRHYFGRKNFLAIGYGSMRQWERKCNGRTLTEDAGERKPPVMSRDDPLGNGEAKPCPSRFTRASFVHPIEAFSQVGQVFGCDPYSCIAYL